MTLESSGRGKYSKYLPCAFTERGVTMAASILNSDKAIEMNIMIVRAFIALKQFAVQYKDLSEQLNEVKNRVGEHDVRLNQIYEAIENLLYEKEEKKRWENRKPIGFKTGVPQTAKG